MKTTRFLALVPLLLALSACIPSIHPFYLPTDVIFDPALVGAWRAADGDEWEQWTFTRRDDSSYEIAIANSEEKTAGLIAHLFTLGGQRYLDVTADSVEFPKTQHELVAISTVRGHLLIRLDQDAGGLRFALFDFEWLEHYLESHPDEIAYRDEDDSLVLTAGTTELQKFVHAHARGGKLFATEDRPLYAPVRETPPEPAAAKEPGPTAQ